MLELGLGELGLLALGLGELGLGELGLGELGLGELGLLELGLGELGLLELGLLELGLRELGLLGLGSVDTGLIFPTRTLGGLSSLICRANFLPQCLHFGPYFPGLGAPRLNASLHSGQRICIRRLS